MLPSVEAALARVASALQPYSPSPRADAEILLAHVLGCDRSRLIAHRETLLTDLQQQAYRTACARRAAGVPVAYITGSAGFYRRDFTVNEHVLIPRPETEHLIDDALAFLQGRPDALIFEAGAGSGAIACTLAAEVPGAIVRATDISADALSVARENAKRLGVESRCTFVQSDVVEEADDLAYDVVIANLPYIPSADIPAAPDPVAYEPLLALDGGADGLTHYRRLLAHVPRLLRAGGLVLLEAAPPTLPALAELTRAALPAAQVTIKRDYAGLERYVRACDRSTGALPRNGE